MALTQRVLDHGWTLSCDRPVGAPTLPQSIPASVPGTVHTDLLAARLIPDPYLDLHEIAVDWVGLQHDRLAGQGRGSEQGRRSGDQEALHHDQDRMLLAVRSISSAEVMTFEFISYARWATMSAVISLTASTFEASV